MTTKHPGLIKIYEQSFIDNYDLPCLTDYTTDATITYGEFAQRIARIHLLYKEAGIKPGDNIALLGKNGVEWVIVFMATITYGAVIVPILNEFNVGDAQQIINHSDAVLLFVDDEIFNGLVMENVPLIRAALSLHDHKVLYDRDKDNTVSASLANLDKLFATAYPKGFGKNNIKYEDRAAENLCLINYTSGTTGYSKGVMLPLRSLWGNVAFGIDSHLHYRGSRALSFLPLAHAYGCAFDLLVPLAVGTHVTLLGRIPTPAILLKAFAKVRPSLVICVPLILEKIYRRMIQPALKKRGMRIAMSIPGLRRIVKNKIRDRLINAFGGQFEEVIVGGAPLSGEVEKFLHDIRFPFTVGYGMTECGPLISYTPWRQFIVGSSGHVLDGYMEARILSHFGHQEMGEIVVHGTNVMLGYYKRPDLTSDVLTDDGWLHTGDMGTLGGDDSKTIFIRGRYKTMILTATGQNIYPEEIEAKLNNMPYVAESLIVERDGHLEALVYADEEAVKKDAISTEALDSIMNKNRETLNTLVAPYERVGRFEMVDSEFEKTPKRSIKRYLYK